MQSQSIPTKIIWSVWDSNPIVSWRWAGGTTTIEMKVPPISVMPLSKHQMVALIGNYDEFGSQNLRLYAQDGTLIHAYSAPAYGDDPQFGAIQEVGEAIEVLIGYRDKGCWVEVAGRLDIASGCIENIHRGY